MGPPLVFIIARIRCCSVSVSFCTVNDLFASSAFIFHKDRELMGVGEYDHCTRPSPAHSKDSQWGFRFGLCGGQSRCENDVSLSPSYLFHMPVTSGKKKSIGGITWSFTIFS